MLFLILMMVLMIVLTVVLDNKTKLLLAGITITAFSLLVVLLLSERLRLDTGNFLRSLTDQLTPSHRSRLVGIPLPAAVLSRKGELVWYNDSFREAMLFGGDFLGMNINKLCDDFDMDAVRAGGSFQLLWNDNWWECSVTNGDIDGEGKYALYFTDINQLKRTEERYIETRPTVMVIVFDNEDELLKARESERLRVFSEVDALINGWIGTSGICWADARDKSLIILEERDASRLIEEKFAILEQARQIVVEDGTPVTLSIGVGRGAESIDECENWARLSLDMALGRGGDQAVVRTAEGFSFFGGVSNSSERQNKVRIRMNAAALESLMKQTDNCLIMGHKYSDLDALGSAIGVYAMMKSAGKETFIVIDRQNSMAKSLIRYYERVGSPDCFIDPYDALDHIRGNTLVVVVDTHARSSMESEAIIDRAENIVIIDHHRMRVDRVPDAKLYIQEPYASSASEIVTELASYMNERAIGKAEADALLSGIMLDTKNFVLSTGVRTFQASAILRKQGADPVEVRRMFSESMETYLAKCSIVSQAQLYKNCAISVVTEQLDSIRVASSQAADDMLTISDVLASFVLYESGGQVNISARSLGRINVQLVMERMGGGGHLTMAAAQLPGATLEDALEQLKASIDKCH
ncbi:MAG: DHH family phosphoesterase [Ruminococcaceae bacterium]|nr:DHH family phosphoesterase [Oscillospiraceae bacterium]